MVTHLDDPPLHARSVHAAAELVEAAPDNLVQGKEDSRRDAGGDEGRNESTDACQTRGGETVRTASATRQRMDRIDICWGELHEHQTRDKQRRAVVPQTTMLLLRITTTRRQSLRLVHNWGF